MIGFMKLLSFGLILVIGGLGVQTVLKRKVEFAKSAVNKGNFITVLLAILLVFTLIEWSSAMPIIKNN